MGNREEVLEELIVDCEARIRGCEIALENERKMLKILQAKLHKARLIKRIDKQPKEAER